MVKRDLRKSSRSCLISDHAVGCLESNTFVEEAIIEERNVGIEGHQIAIIGNWLVAVLVKGMDGLN